MLTSPHVPRAVRFALPTVIFAVFLGLPAIVRSDDPVTSSVTFNREVVRIFERKCLPCHETGAVAMPLATYRQARLWARSIREELVEQRMPPWPAAPGYGAFSNAIGLTERELTTVLSWTDGGLPRGDDRDLPGSVLGLDIAKPDAGPRPDRVLELPVQRIPAGEEHLVRRVTVDAGFGEEWRATSVAIVPGNRRVLRAAFISILQESAAPHWIGSWTPWLHRVEPPGGAAFLVPAGSQLVVELHYRGRETELEDRSSLALSFSSEVAATASQIVVETARTSSGDGLARRRGRATLREDAEVWAIVPSPAPSSAARQGASLEVSARRPDGIIEVLLWIPPGRYDWPTPYILKSPVRLPAGTIVTVTAASDLGLEAAPPVSVTLSSVRSTAAATPSRATRQRP
jgi:hypothetical protein